VQNDPFSRTDVTAFSLHFIGQPFVFLRYGNGQAYLLSEHPGGGEGYVFLISALSLQLENGWAEGVGSLRRSGIRRLGIF
jgi:hypothetical protein